MARKLTNDEFIQRAKEKHGDVYDYSKTAYRGMHSRVTIICAQHGDFQHTPGHHIHNLAGCPTCAQNAANDGSITPAEERKLQAIAKDPRLVNRLVDILKENEIA